MKTSINLDEDLKQWADEMIKKKRFGSVSHAVNYSLQRLRENEEEELHIKRE